MRKIFTLCLAVALLWGGLPAICAETDNLLSNSGFETVDPGTGKPIAWSTFNGWTDDSAPTATRQVLTKENPHSGTYCAKIWIDNGKNHPSVSQTVSGLMPGGIYEVGYWAKGRSGKSIFKLQLEYKKNGEVVKTEYAVPSIPDTEWKMYSKTFSVPENVDSVFIQFKLFGNGTVFLDDTFFRLVSEKPNYTLETDAVFYYSDDTTPAEATVSAVNPGNATVSFSLKEGETAVLTQEARPFVNGKVTFTFPVLQTLTKAKTAYTLEATVTENGKARVLSKTIYRYDRPSRLRKDGVYLKNGEPFVPVIAHGINIEELSKCKEAGINVVTVSYWYADFLTDKTRITTILKALKEYDLMAIVGLYRNMMQAGDDYNANNTVRLVSAIAKDPELRDVVYAYSLMDEPLQNDIACDEELAKGYKLVRDADSEIPVLTVDCHSDPAKAKRVLDYCDIYSCDAYYAGNGELASWPGEMVALSVREAEAGQRTVYHLTQAFDWRNQFPTSDEIRHMFYQSLLNGAKGFGYYTISHATKDADGKDVPLYNTDRWPGLIALWEKEMPMAFDYFVHGKYPKVTDIDGIGYTGAVWEKDNRLYILILNRDGTERTVEVEIPYQSFLLAKQGEEPFAAGTENTAVYNLAPREAVLLEAEEIGKMKLYKQDGTETETPEAGETVTARICMPAAFGDVTGRIGFYGEISGIPELYAIQCMTKESKNVYTELTAQFTVPEKNLYYKTFLWDGLHRPVQN